MMLPALTTSRKWSSRRRYTRMSSTNVPCSVVSAEYCAWPTESLAASLLVSHWTAWRASAPAISIWPMWLTSKSPAAVRTARCSSVMPEYSTGMSQPANSTMRAPCDRCRALSGVFLKVAGALDVMRPIQRTIRVHHGQGAAAPRCSSAAFRLGPQDPQQHEHPRQHGQGQGDTRARPPGGRNRHQDWRDEGAGHQPRNHDLQNDDEYSSHRSPPPDVGFGAHTGAPNPVCARRRTCRCS